MYYKCGSIEVRLLLLIIFSDWNVCLFSHITVEKFENFLIFKTSLKFSPPFLAYCKCWSVEVRRLLHIIFSERKLCLLKSDKVTTWRYGWKYIQHITSAPSNSTCDVTLNSMDSQSRKKSKSRIHFICKVIGVQTKAKLSAKYLLKSLLKNKIENALNF